MTDERRTAIAANLLHIKEGIRQAAARSGRAPEDVRLVAVSKNFPLEDVARAMEAGQTLFGENRVQELLPKMEGAEKMDLACEWHMIGTLQRNKVRFLAGKVSLIHSVNSLGLLSTIDRLAGDRGLVQDVLLQVNVSGEESKQGFSPSELPAILEAARKFGHVRLCGLMTMAPFYDDPEEARRDFSELRELRDRTVAREGLPSFTELSMGMTNDYLQAVEEGATLVRIGSAIFGSRIF